MRYTDREPDDDAEWDDHDSSDGDLDDEGATVACPECGEEVYEDAERCPRCGHYLTEEAAARKSKPWWIVAGVVLCLALVYLWIFGPALGLPRR